MSENQGEDASIDLSVNADEALQVFEQLSAAARDADEQIQQLKQHLTAQVTATFGAQGQQPQTYQQASATLARMDPAEVAQAAPDIAQTQAALAERRAEVQARAMDFAGTTPNLVNQPLPDTLAQFQQAMAQREQQQQAQRERQAQQAAAGVERPARYGYDQSAPPASSHASSTPTPLPLASTIQAMGPAQMMSVAPLATTSDERLAHALSAQAPTGTSAPGRATGARDNDNAPMGDVLPAESGRSSPAPATVQPVAPLATTGDDRLTQALMAQTPTATPPTGRAAAARDDAPMGDLPADLQALATAVISADTGIQRLQQHLVEAVNQQMGQAGIRPQTFEQAQDLLGRMPAADLAAAAPDVVALQQRISARSAEVTNDVTAFAGQNPQATTGQPLGDVLNELKAFVQQQQRQVSTVGGASSAPSAGGTGAGADTSAALRYGLLPSTPPTLTPGGDMTQTDRFASTMGERLASSMARAGVGMVSGGIQGAANAAGMGATGDLVAGLARPLMAMVSAPLAIAAGVIGGVAGVGLGVNALQSRYAGEERQLAGSVGTSTGATPEGELTTAQNVGWRYWYHEQQSVAAAQQLGDVGVTSDQMGGALTQSMALARLSGLGLDQTVGLTGQMMQGGMSSNQVGQAYAEIDQVSKLVPVSLGRITEGIKAMNAAAGVGQISLNGLAATQALSDASGAKINVGQAMAGTIGSTGTNALAQGAILGLDPTAFSNAQRDPAKLWDAYANTARRYDVGAGGTRIAQQALSQSGFDFSSMKGGQADTFIQKLVSEGPGAAQKYEQSLQQKENAPHAAGPHTADQFAASGKAFADQVTPAGDKVKIDLEQGAAAIVRAVGLSRPDAINHALKLVQTAPNPAVRAARLLQYEQMTNGQAYANDPNAAGTMDASKGSHFGPLSEYDLSQARQSGMWTGGAPGKGSFVDAVTFHAYEASARKTGDPLPVLLAQGAKEATVNGQISPSARSADGGVGLGQWTPGPHNENLPTIEKYLGAASKDLGLGPVTAANWREAALNPRISALGTGLYDRDLYQSHGHNWEKALAPYNGSGPQAQAYGVSVNSDAQKIEIQLGGSIDITHSGVKVGTGQVGQHIRATATHSIDTSRKHVGAQSYGPDQRPPSPGLPNLPGHIGGPIRR